MVLAVVLLMVMAGCSRSSDPLPLPSSALKSMTTFSVNGVTGTINETAKTIAVTMPYGTNVTALVATFSTNGASVKVGSTVQQSGITANNFSHPVIYTVIAADGTVQTYIVVVNVSFASSKAITAFSLNGVAGAINETGKTIAVTMPYGTNVTALAATFTTTGASVKVGSIPQISGQTANNFTHPVTYTVTAPDSSTQDYTVVVAVALSSAKAITAFSLEGVTGTINETAKTIAVTMPYGTDVTTLVATFTTTGASVQVGSTLQISGFTANNFTSPVTYTVTAADATTQDYTVTVAVALNPAKAITAFSLNSVTGTINETAKTIAVTMPYGTNVTALVATFSTTGVSVKVGSTLQISGTTPNNFTSPVTYTVTAADATTQDYTVTVTVEPADYTSPNIGTLKYVPAGSFQRDATATNISTISTAFRMSQYEITRAQFLSMMGTDPSSTSNSTGISDPVQMVTWYDAAEFCNMLSIDESLTPAYTISSRVPVSGYPITSATVTANWSANGYRLPTEMEWMWAAMGATSDRSNGYTGTGTNTTGYTKGYAGSTEAGGAQANIGDYAWIWENSSAGTKEVGTRTVNELGLYDMSGNVWEWVWDWYAAYPAGALVSNTDGGRGAASGTDRVGRGGSWGNNASYATVAVRSNGPPGDRGFLLGFRVVRP